jgi:hypothetical protein
MILVGKNYAGYGAFLDTNFIHMLENSANSTAPAAPLTGQLWWDSTNSLLKVYNGTTFKTISAATASATQPTSNVTGDLWYDTVNQQVKVYTGSSFLVVGPAYTSSSGTAGAIPETINDNTATPHYVTTLYVNNVRVAIISNDSNFTAAAPVSTLFPTVYKGMTMSNATGTNISGNLVGAGNVVVTAAGSNTVATFTGTGANITGYVTSTANITGGNILTGGLISATGTVTASSFIGNIVSPAGSPVSTTGNVTGGNLLTGGIASATGNITGGNILTGGIVSATGNITGGNINATAHTGTTVSITGNVDAGNLRSSGLISVAGNITSSANIAGTYLLGNGAFLQGLSLGVSVSQIQNGNSSVRIGATDSNVAISVGATSNVVVVDTTTLYANVLSPYSIIKQAASTNAVGNIGSSTNYFNQTFTDRVNATTVVAAGNVTGGNVLTAGLVSATSTITSAANITGGNILTGGLISATGAVTGSNLTTGGQVSAVGNVTGNYIFGNGALLTGVITSVANINSGTSNVTVVSSGGNVSVSVGGTSNVAVFSSTGEYITGVVSASGNVTGGNLLTAGSISATGNITTPGYFIGTFAGNISGNLTVPGSNTQVLFNNSGNAGASSGFTFSSASNAAVIAGNITGGNLLTGGLISAASTVTGSQFNGSGAGLTSIPAANVTGTLSVNTTGYAATVSTAAQPNITSVGTLSSLTVTANVTGGNILTGGLISAAGTITGTSYLGAVVSVTANVTGGNLLTGGLISATGAVTGGSLATGGTASATGNITGGNILSGGLISVAGGITGGSLTVSTGNVGAGNINNNNANGVGNIGSSTSYFNRLFATATTALYADVAERFAADEFLEAGTVVELGGVAEITKSRTELSDKVFGVISTRAAYLMNGGAGEDSTHPPVAMTGRVPVKVVGVIHKGDRLVSAGDGIARAAAPGEATSFNVIGRSLVDKLTPESGTIEAIVTIKN